MDYSQFAGALTNAGEAVRRIYEMRVSADVSKALEDIRESLFLAQGAALTAQQEQSTLSERVRQLETELLRLRDWSADKQRYKLVQTSQGLVVHAVKGSQANGEAPHYLCSNCYSDGKKSFLSPRTSKDGFAYLACSYCKAEHHPRLRQISFQYASD